MPYFFIAAAFVVISLAGLAATITTRFFGPLRMLFPYTWRAWLWGTVGFLIANGVFISLLAWAVNSPIWPARGSPGDSASFLFVAGILLAPFLVSVLGATAGIGLGLYLAWTKRRTIR